MSVAVAGVGAPPPLAVDVFVALGIAAAPTATTSAIGGAFVPGLTDVVDVHVTACPAPVHVQPGPVAETNVRPAGSVSATVIVPVVAALPLLPTSSVNVPCPPTGKFAVCDFVSVSPGTPLTVVVSLALTEPVAPPPDAVAVFVTLGIAATPTAATIVIGFPVELGAIGVDEVHVISVPFALHVQPTPLAENVGESVRQRVGYRDRAGRRNESGITYGDRVRAVLPDGEIADVRLRDR